MMQLKRAKIIDKVIDLKNFNDMMAGIEAVVNMAVCGGLVVISRFPTLQLGMKPSASGSNMDYSDFAFGFSISGAVVSLNAGEARRGKRTIIDVAATTKTIGADHQYLWLEYATITQGCGWAEPDVQRPKSDDITYRLWFYRFRLIDGVASLEKGYIGHLGNMEIPGMYG